MKFLNICNLYTSAWCLYWLQGFLYTKGSPIGKSLLFVILLISLYYFLLNLFKVNNLPYLKALNALVILFTIYGIISMLAGTVSVTEAGDERTGFDFVKQYYSSILPIYAYFNFARDGYIDERWFAKWIYVFFGVAIISFYTGRNELLQRAIEMGTLQTEFTNNFAYLFVALIPAISLVYWKPTLQWFLWLIVVAFSLMSFKRGAILTTGVCFIYFLNAYITTRYGVKKRYVLLAIIVFLGAYLVLDYLVANSDYFFLRLEQTQEGNLSRRDELYAKAIDVFKGGGLFQLLFGHGANSTATLLGNGAHNDWLEILICHGIVGVFFFAVYWIVLMRLWLKTEKGSIIRVTLGLFFISTFIRTMISFSIGDMSYFSTSVIGFCLSNCKKSVVKNEDFVLFPGTK